MKYTWSIHEVYMKYTWSTFDNLTAALLIFKALCESLQCDLKVLQWFRRRRQESLHQSQSPKARVRITMDCVSVASLSCYSIFLQKNGAGRAGRATALWLLYPVTWRVVQWTRCILPCWVGSEFREVWQALPLRPQIVRHKARCQRFQWDLVVQWTHGFVWTWWEPPQTFSQAHLHATGFSKQLPHQWNDNSKRGSRRDSSTGAVAAAWGFFPAPETSAAGTRWAQFLHDCMIFIILH